MAGLKDQIQAWLELPTKGQGQKLLQLLELPYSDDLMIIIDRLRSALQKPIQEPPPPAEDPQIPAGHPPDPLSKLDPYLELLKAHSKTMLRERTTLHSQLLLMDNSERYKAAARIKEITTQLDELWDQIRMIRDTGQIPGSLLPGGGSYLQGVKDFKRYKNILSQISQARSELRKVTGKKDQARIREKIERLQGQALPLKSKFKELL